MNWRGGGRGDRRSAEQNPRKRKWPLVHEQQYKYSWAGRYLPGGRPEDSGQPIPWGRVTGSRETMGGINHLSPRFTLGN